MTKWNYDFVRNCLNCGSELGSDTHSDRHARVVDTPLFRLDLVWCASCGQISIRDKSPIYTRFKLWKTTVLYDFFPFRQNGHYSFDSIMIKYSKLSGAQRLIRELLYHIYLSLIESIDTPSTLSSHDREAAAWAVAKIKLSPLPLSEYVNMRADVIGNSKAAQWLKEIETEHSASLEPHQREYFRSLRSKYER